MTDKDALGRRVLSTESALRKASNEVTRCESEARSRRVEYGVAKQRAQERPKNKRAAKGAQETYDRLGAAVETLEAAEETRDAAAKAHAEAVKERNDFGKPKKRKAKKKAAPKPEPNPAPVTNPNTNGTAGAPSS